MAANPFRSTLWLVLRIGGLIGLCLFLISKAPPTVERERLREHGVVLQLDETGDVMGLELTADVFYDEVLNDISAVNSIRSVTLKQLTCSDELMSVIVGLPNLRSVSCVGCTISDKQLSLLQNTQLQAIDLSDTTGPIDGLAALGQQQSLVSFACHGCRWFADDDLRLLCSFPKIREIDISETSITDNRLESLKFCAELGRVDLSSCDQLIDVSLRQLEFCKSLTSIRIYGVPVALSSAAEFQAARPAVRLAYDQALARDFVRLMQELSTAKVTTGVSIESPPSPAATGLIQTLKIELQSARDISVLKYLSQLKALQLTGPGVEDSVVPTIAAMRNLRSLDLSQSRISESAFSEMPVFQHMAAVSLVDTQVSEATLRWLAALPKLGSLDLSGATIAGSAIDAPLTFSNLKYLDLSGAHGATNILAQLDKPVLVELRLGSCNLNDEDLKSLAAYSSLQRLDLSGNRLQGHGLNSLAAFSRLHTLDLSGNPLEGHGLAALREVPLNFLRLESCGLNDSSLSSLVANPKLQALDLSGNPLEGHGLESMRDVPLTHLRLHRSGLTDAGLEKISSLKGLRRLDVSGTTITGTGFTTCSELPIYSINLDGVTLSTEGIEAICSLTALILVDLQNAVFTEDSLKLLGNRLRLKGVPLDGKSEMIQAFVQTVAAAELEFLVLNRPDKDALLLIGQFPAVHNLTLNHGDVDQAAAEMIIRAPKCTTLTLNECTVSAAGMQTLVSSETLQRIRLDGMDTTPIDTESLQRMHPHINITVDPTVRPSNVSDWSSW